MWFKALNGIGSTAENLLHAAEGENYEWTDMYAEFAKVAEEEAPAVEAEATEAAEAVEAPVEETAAAEAEAPAEEAADAEKAE